MCLFIFLSFFFKILPPPLLSSSDLSSQFLFPLFQTLYFSNRCLSSYILVVPSLSLGGPFSLRLVAPWLTIGFSLSLLKLLVWPSLSLSLSLCDFPCKKNIGGGGWWLWSGGRLSLVVGCEWVCFWSGSWGGLVCFSWDVLVFWWLLSLVSILVLVGRFLYVFCMFGC